MKLAVRAYYVSKVKGETWGKNVPDNRVIRADESATLKIRVFRINHDSLRNKKTDLVVMHPAKNAFVSNTRVFLFQMSNGQDVSCVEFSSEDRYVQGLIQKHCTPLHIQNIDFMSSPFVKLVVLDNVEVNFSVHAHPNTTNNNDGCPDAKLYVSRGDRKAWRNSTEDEEDEGESYTIPLMDKVCLTFSLDADGNESPYRASSSAAEIETYSSFSGPCIKANDRHFFLNCIFIKGREMDLRDVPYVFECEEDTAERFTADFPRPRFVAIPFIELGENKIEKWIVILLTPKDQGEVVVEMDSEILRKNTSFIYTQKCAVTYSTNASRSETEGEDTEEYEVCTAAQDDMLKFVEILKENQENAAWVYVASPELDAGSSHHHHQQQRQRNKKTKTKEKKKYTGEGNKFSVLLREGEDDDDDGENDSMDIEEEEKEKPPRKKKKRLLSYMERVNLWMNRFDTKKRENAARAMRNMRRNRYQSNGNLWKETEKHLNMAICDPERIDARHVSVPADGSCFFHAMSKCTGNDPDFLRKAVASTVLPGPKLFLGHGSEGHIDPDSAIFTWHIMHKEDPDNRQFAHARCLREFEDENGDLDLTDEARKRLYNAMCTPVYWGDEYAVAVLESVFRTRIFTIGVFPRGPPRELDNGFDHDMRVEFRCGALPNQQGRDTTDYAVVLLNANDHYDVLDFVNSSGEEEEKNYWCKYDKESVPSIVQRVFGLYGHDPIFENLGYNFCIEDRFD